MGVQRDIIKNHTLPDKTYLIDNPINRFRPVDKRQSLKGELCIVVISNNTY